MRLIVLISLLFAFNTWAKIKPETVSFVDIQRYQGVWYEIAKFDNWFQKDCAGAKVEYTLKANGKVKVFNQCNDKKRGGIKSVTGEAFVKDTKTNAKLKVSFTKLFKKLFAGNYWILDLDHDYQYVLVGSPNRKYLWILARTPNLSSDIINNLKNVALEQGFDVSKLNTSPIFFE